MIFIFNLTNGLAEKWFDKHGCPKSGEFILDCNTCTCGQTGGKYVFCEGQNNCNTTVIGKFYLNYLIIDWLTLFL